MNRKFIEEPRVIKAPVFPSNYGDLSVIDQTTGLPFQMKRIFYVYNNPLGSIRGGHAHKNLKEFIWCISGKIEVFTISLLREKSNFILDNPDKGLYIPEKTWSYQISLSENSIYCVICSDIYIKEDYIRKFDKFEKLFVDD